MSAGGDSDRGGLVLVTKGLRVLARLSPFGLPLTLGESMQPMVKNSVPALVETEGVSTSG